MSSGEAPGQDELARRAGLSRFHFLRRWTEAFGVTPHQDLTRLRIERAKALLAAESASVTDVCLEVVAVVLRVPLWGGGPVAVAPAGEPSAGLA